MAKGILNVGGGVVSVDASGNFTVETGLIADGASVFNETGVDVDFRIESDDNANMLFVDGGNDRVGIGIATPASALDVRGTVQVGVDNTGYDVQFYGATSGRYWLWDESADGVVQIGTLTVGVDDAGHDVNFFGATASSYWMWDESADKTILVGDSTQTGNAQLTGTLTVGVNDTGHDVKFFGAASGAYMLWDESVDDLILAGAARVVVPDGQLVLGSTAVTQTAAQINLHTSPGYVMALAIALG